MPMTFAEIALLAVLLWGFYRLLTPVRRRIERLLLRLLDPTRAEIVDAQIVSNDKKTPQE